MEELEISKILLSFSSSITNLSNLETRKQHEQQEQKREQENREIKMTEEISVPISMPTPVPTPSPVKMSEQGVETEQLRLYYHHTEPRAVPLNDTEKEKVVLDLHVEESHHLPTPASTPSSTPTPIPIQIRMPVSLSLTEPLLLHSISSRIPQPRRISRPNLAEEVECIDLRIHRRKRSSQSTNDNKTSSRRHHQHHHQHHHRRGHHLLPRKGHRAPPSNNLMDVNGNQLPIFACPYCDYWTTEDGHLTIHMTSHANSFVPYKCSLCEYYSADQATLTKHSLKNHGPGRDQEVPSSCSKSELEKKAHIKCPFPGCLYFAKHRSLLRSHQIVHTQEKAFCCEVCLKKFGRRSDKNRHMRSHGRLSNNVHNNINMNLSSGNESSSYPVHRPQNEIYDHHHHPHIPFVRSPPLEKMQTQSVERPAPSILSYPASVIKFGSDYRAHARDEIISRFQTQPRANWE